MVEEGGSGPSVVEHLPRYLSVSWKHIWDLMGFILCHIRHRHTKMRGYQLSHDLNSGLSTFRIDNSSPKSCWKCDKGPYGLTRLLATFIDQGCVKAVPRRQANLLCNTARIFQYGVNHIESLIPSTSSQKTCEGFVTLPVDRHQTIFPTVKYKSTTAQLRGKRHQLKNDKPTTKLADSRT